MKKQIFIFALFISFFGSGFEHTFLNTLIPIVTLDLGGIEYFTWTSISFTLGNMLLLPLMGRLADKYNKIHLFLIGNLILGTGALLSAFSQNMVHLILARFWQGIGSGMITVLTAIMIATVFPVKERIKWNAILGVVYSVATFIGPVAAGYLANTFSWRAIFISPIIFFTVANIFMMSSSIQNEYQEIKNKSAGSFMSNFLLIIIVTLNALLISLGGVVIPFSSPLLYILLFIIVLLIYILYLFEKNAEVGVLPYQYFKQGLFVKSLIISIGGAIGKLIILTFTPMFIMLTLQVSIEKSGFVLIPMLIMAPISAFIFGKLLLMMPYRFIIFLSSISIASGLFLFSLITPDSHYYEGIIASTIAGLGAGSISQLLLIILQEHYPKKDLSVITSTFTFFRWQGNIIGVSIGNFLLMFFSILIFGDTKENIDINTLYKQVFGTTSNYELIVSWSSIFQNLFLVISIILFIISSLAFFLGKGKVE